MELDVTKQTYSVDKDAFSSGQVGSKIWLCEEIEKLFSSIDLVWVYGGWHGIAGFLLLSRNNVHIGKIKSFDLDPSCESIADMLNENWVIKDWQFKAVTEDCNNIKFEDSCPDLIINTSTEHFTSRDWWNNIPKGTVVALQGNNMPHDDHHVHTGSLDEFVAQYPLSELLYSGEREFVYPTWSFTRFMVIGHK